MLFVGPFRFEVAGNRIGFAVAATCDLEGDI
jgi:hypothetical protein